MRIDRAGIPFIVFSLGVAFLFSLFVGIGPGVPFAILAGFLAFFFRDPDRRVPEDKHAVVSAADGRVVHAGAAEESSAPTGTWQQVSVFLSPLDVHVNRVPVSGIVTRVAYRRGRFLPAYRAEASKENERCETWIEHDGQQVICRQVVGALARRVVCRLQPGMTVGLGQRFGIMKFGSRIDVFVPTMASLQVKVGDIVRGGETVLALLYKSSPGDDGFGGSI